MSLTYDTLITKYVLDDGSYVAGAKRVTQATHSIDRAVSGTKRGLSTLGTSLAFAGGAMATGILAFLGFAGKADAEMDSLNRSLTAIAGSAEEAKKQFKELLELANKSPVLDLSSAIQGAIALQSTRQFGFGESKSIMSTVSNAVAFSGGDIGGFERVLVNLQQIAGQGKLTGDELRETAAIIPSFRKALEDAFPNGTQGMTGVQVIRGVIAELNKLPEVGGGVQTSYDNITSAMKRGFGAVGSVLNSVLVPAFDAVGGFLNQLVDSGVIEKIGKSLVESFDGKKLADAMITGISYFLAAIEKAPVIASKVSKSMVDSFGAVAQSLGLVAAILGAIFLTGTIANIVAGVRLMITVISDMVMAIRAWGVAQMVTNAIATKGASLLKDIATAGVAAAAGYALFKAIEALLPKMGEAAVAGLGLDEIAKRAAEIKAGITGGNVDLPADPGVTPQDNPLTKSMDKHLERIDRHTEKMAQVQQMILGGGAVTDAAFNAVNLSTLTGGGRSGHIGKALDQLQLAINKTMSDMAHGMSRGNLDRRFI